MTPQAKRRKRVRQWLEANGVDALLVSTPSNVFYLFGFRGEGLGVVGASACLATDRRYELAAAALPGRLKTKLHPDGHLAGATEFLQETGARRVAFEAEFLTYGSYETLAEKLGKANLIPSRKVVEDLRVVKDATEIQAVSSAAAIMDKALEEVVAGLAPGMTEKQAALELERAALLGGAEKMAFETIFAFGSSAAHPHAVPGDRCLEKGQLVKVDCGARVGGYCSDITRTYFVGKPDPQFLEVYGAVLAAQEAAVAAARPGMTGRELDAVARDIVRERGFEREFSHGLGHGVGLEVHEMPRVSSRGEESLKAGMVITIEPGVYIEGWGGVRIEDTVALTTRGCEPLTHAPKQRHGL